MHNGPYRSRHSVWVDVLAIVFVGAVILGGAGYLLYHAGGAAPGFTEGSGGHAGAASPRSVPPPAGPSRSFRGSGGGPALGRRTGPPSSGRSGDGGNSAVPFSESWRSGATPDLGVTPERSGPAPSSGGRAGGAAPSEIPQPGSPAIASSPSGTVPGAGGASYGSTDRSPGWRAEAKRLGGQARALSSELRRLNQQSPETERETSSDDPATATAPSGSAETSDRDVPNPPDPVPIGDHLHWLAIAGVLWGAWRIGRGG
jgi:hypothetical protein